MIRERLHLPLALAVTGTALLSVWVLGMYGRTSRNSPAPAYPRRVVSLSPALTEMVYAMGGGDLLVGRTKYCDWPPDALDVPVVGGYTDVDVEKVLLLEPDLVVVSPSPGNKEAVQRLADSGTRALVSPLYSVEEILEGIVRLGKALGREEAALEITSRMEGNLADIGAEALSRQPVEALVVVSQQPMVLAAEGSFPHELLVIAGGKNVVSVSAKPYVQADVEWLSAHPPQVVVDVSAAHPGPASDDATILRAYRGIPGWTGKVNLVVVRDDAVTIPGPRLDSGALILFKALHGKSNAVSD